MSEVINQKNAVILAAAERMVELGSEAAQRMLVGKDSVEQYADGHKILSLLRAYVNEADMTDVEKEALLYCLRKLSGDSDFPTVEPLVGKGITYVVQQSVGSGGISLTPGVNTVIWSAGTEWEVITLQELWNKLMAL